MDAILGRRSIRKYTDQPVSDESMDGLLRAAMAAPSARNQQPWHFVVIRDGATLQRIAKEIDTAAMAGHAPAAITVCADLALEKSPGYWVQDCAAATENILIAANAAGLGAVWCGIYPREPRVESIRSILSLPENVMPLSLIVVGHPAERPARVDRFQADRVHCERW